MSTRRDRFREQIRRLEATGAGDKALAEGWVRARPSPGLAEQIAAPLDLKDGVSLALIGGIGSGKTTELLRVRELLRTDKDRVVAYVDVGQRASLASLKRQALIGVVGMALADELAKRGVDHAEALGEQLSRETLGYFEDEQDDDDHREPFEFIPGVASPPPSPHGPLGAILLRLADRARKAGLGLLALIDGLDRLSSIDPWLSLRADIATISKIGIGALYVAPVSFLLNPAHRDVSQIFDQALPFPYVDAQTSPEARRFLVDVLRARSVEATLSDEVCERLADLSGGALRDLLQLAQLATQISYGRGEERVDLSAVEEAADRLGRRLLLGVGEEQLETLHTLRRTGRFALTTDATVALVVGCLVLFYEGPRFAVHPCVEPILARLSSVRQAHVY